MRVAFAVRSLAQEPCKAAGRGPVDGLEPLMLGREGQFCLQRSLWLSYFQMNGNIASVPGRASGIARSAVS